MPIIKAIAAIADVDSAATDTVKVRCTKDEAIAFLEAMGESVENLKNARQIATDYPAHFIYDKSRNFYRLVQSEA